jgi:hypothetical protein
MSDAGKVDLLDGRPPRRRVANMHHRGKVIPFVGKNDHRPMKRSVAFHQPRQELEPVDFTHLHAHDDDGRIDVMNARQRPLGRALEDQLRGCRSAEDTGQISLVRFALLFREDAQDALRGHGVEA